jgi:hypothetical protein
LFSKYDLDDKFIIFLYPLSFSANNGKSPIVSSNLKFICVPIIGTNEVFYLNQYMLKHRALHTYLDLNKILHL